MLPNHLGSLPHSPFTRCRVSYCFSFYLCAARPPWYLCTTAGFTNGASVDIAADEQTTNKGQESARANWRSKFKKTQLCACDFRATTTWFAVARGHSSLSCGKTRKNCLSSRKYRDDFRNTVAPLIFVSLVICAYRNFLCRREAGAIFCPWSCYWRFVLMLRG